MYIIFLQKEKPTAQDYHLLSIFTCCAKMQQQQSFDKGG